MSSAPTTTAPKAKKKSLKRSVDRPPEVVDSSESGDSRSSTTTSSKGSRGSGTAPGAPLRSAESLPNLLLLAGSMPVRVDAVANTTSNSNSTTASLAASIVPPIAKKTRSSPSRSKQQINHIVAAVANSNTNSSNSNTNNNNNSSSSVPTSVSPASIGTLSSSPPRPASAGGSLLSRSASSTRSKLELASSPAPRRPHGAAHESSSHENDADDASIRRHSGASKSGSSESYKHAAANSGAAAAAAAGAPEVSTMNLSASPVAAAAAPAGGGGVAASPPSVVVSLNSAGVIPVAAVPFLTESGDTIASLEAAAAAAELPAPTSVAPAPPASASASASASVSSKKKDLASSASPPRVASSSSAAAASTAASGGGVASKLAVPSPSAGGGKSGVADPPLRRVARRTRRTSSGHGSKSRSSLRRVSVAKDGSGAGAASDATAYDEGDDAVSFDKLPVRDLGTASESDDSHRRLFTHVYSSDSHSEASQLKVSQSQQLLVRELQALLERQEAYSSFLQASLLRTQVLAEQQSSVLAELVTALHSSEPNKAVNEKRDVWLTRIELHGELSADTPPAFPVHRSSERTPERTRKASMRLSNSSSRLSDSDTANKTSSSATNLTSTLSSASSTSDDDADETTDSSMPSARTTTQSFTTQSFTTTLATIPDDEDEDEDDGPAGKLSPRTGSLMLGAISRASPTLRQRSDSQAASPATIKKEVSVGAMPLGRVVPRMPGLGPPKATSNEPMLLPTPALGSAKVPVKDRRFDFATRGRSQSVNLSPRGMTTSLNTSVRLFTSNSSTQSGGSGGNGSGGSAISVPDAVSASPPSPEPGGSLGSSASSRHSAHNDKRRVSATPASNDASSSKDSASQQGDDGKPPRRTSSSATGASGGSGNAANAPPVAGFHSINLATDTVQLHETLGKGGTASVYRASASGFSFACKVYHAEELSDAERAAAERDVAMMEAMSHNNVLRTLGHKYARLGRLLLYVELAGGTLADAIKAKREAPNATGGFAPVDILRAIGQVLAAVEYLHHRPQPIVHRDVKSENVFVCCTAGSPLESIGALHLKLGDFDSARYLGSSTERANGDRGALWRLKLRTSAKRRTVRLSMNVGTPEFMAPEMVASQKGNGSYDEKVDVWSVGMVLFELLTLDVPYRLNGLSRFELLDAVASGVRPTVDPALQKKVALRKLWKLWNKFTEFDAERRLSAAAAAKRVHKVLKGMSTIPI